MKLWTWLHRRRQLKSKAEEQCCRESSVLMYACRCVLQTTLCPFSITLKPCNEYVVVEHHSVSDCVSVLGEISAEIGDRVELLEQSPSFPTWCLVRTLENRQQNNNSISSRHGVISYEGLLPAKILRPTASVIAVPISLSNNLQEKPQTSDQIEMSRPEDKAKRKSFKKWFVSHTKRKPIATRQLSVDAFHVTCPTNAHSEPYLVRTAASMYGKLKSDYTGSWSKSDAKCCPATSDTCTTDKLKINDKSSNHRNLLTPPFASEEDLDDSEQFSSSIGGGREETPCSNCTTGQSSSYSIDIAAQPPTSATMQNNSDLIYCNDKNKSSDVASIKEEDRANSAVSSATIGDDRHINGVEEEDIKIKEENHVPESTTLGSALSVEEMGDEKEQASSPISLRPDDEEQPPQSESNEQLISSSVDQNDKKLVISIDNHSLSGGNMNESSLPGSNEITEVAVEPDEPSQAAASESAAELPPEEQAKAKRKYVLMEFLETERDYVKDLGSVVEGYMATIDSMELPEDMKGKERFVFANIQQIHEFHKNTFLKEIEPCVEDYDAVGRAFVKYERRLHMYVVYCQNKPKSEFLVSEYETFFNDIKQKLGHRLNIADLLIKPVQRIMKYQLLMKDILKYTERAGQDVETLKKALQVMHVVPKACDDMMHVGRLQGFEGKITAQGKLLHQGTLVVSDNPSNQVFKGKDRRLFLFEQSLIIADCILPKKEFSNPQYIYKSHIMINKMGMETEVPGEPLRLILKNKDPTGPQDVVVQCSSAEDKQQWVTQVKQLLDTQMDFLKALQHPIAYQKQLNKDEDEVVKPKNVKSPIMSRLAQLKGGSKEKQPQRTESCPGPANAAANSAPRPASVSAVASPTADSRKHSLPDPKNSDSSKANKGAAGSTTTSPKSKSKLFDGFRNPLKSRSTKL